MTMTANSRLYAAGSIPMVCLGGNVFKEKEKESVLPRVKKPLGAITRARAKKPCHKHGLVNCTLEQCPLRKGFGYLIECESPSNPSFRSYSSTAIAYMECYVCGKTGDHWYIDCPKYVPNFAARKPPAAATATNNPTDDFRAGGPQTRSETGCDQNCNTEESSSCESEVCEGRNPNKLVDNGSNKRKHSATTASYNPTDDFRTGGPQTRSKTRCDQDCIAKESSSCESEICEGSNSNKLVVSGSNKRKRCL